MVGYTPHSFNMLQGTPICTMAETFSPAADPENQRKCIDNQARCTQVVNVGSPQLLTVVASAIRMWLLRYLTHWPASSIMEYLILTGVKSSCFYSRVCPVHIEMNSNTSAHDKGLILTCKDIKKEKTITTM
ncbi:UNVERIFIED_CONTAM: hypothetical protein FKN15_050539 [Acipenser sinensis]